MKPFFNFGCALVAWAELCRAAHTRNYPGSADPLPPQAFCQGPHNNQFLYAKSSQLLTPYQAILLEPLWLLDQRQDGRWQLVATALGNGLNLRLQALLRAWMPAIPLAEEAGPRTARLRLAIRGSQEPAPPPLCLPIARPAADRSPLTRGIAPYLEQISSIVQLEDARDGRLLGGGVNLRGERPVQASVGGKGWQDLLACNWQQLMQFDPSALAAG